MLFVQPRDRAAETWTGYRPGTEGAVADYQADEAYPRTDRSWRRCPKSCAGARTIYHALGRRRGPRRQADRAPGSVPPAEPRGGVCPATDLVDPRSLIHEMRIRKSDPELEIMRRAADISRDAHHRACADHPGRSLTSTRSKRRWHAYSGAAAASGPAYGSIVGGGANATILHYVTQRSARSAMAISVLIDAGAELDGYASDVTRTYPVERSLRARARAIYEVVLAAQEAALSAAKPGTTLPEIHAITVRMLVEGMLSLGLLDGRDRRPDRERSLQAVLHARDESLARSRCPRRRQLHARRRQPRPLEPGMVFTVEPGIYVAADDERAPESFRGIGVRIEDDVVVTSEWSREPDPGDSQETGRRRGLDPVAARGLTDVRFGACHEEHASCRCPGRRRNTNSISATPPYRLALRWGSRARSLRSESCRRSHRNRRTLVRSGGGRALRSTISDTGSTADAVPAAHWSPIRHGRHRIPPQGEANLQTGRRLHTPGELEQEDTNAEYRKLGDKNPTRFWAQMAKENVSWFSPWKKVLDWKPPFAKWFVGGKTNVCYNCLDRHLEGENAWRKNKAAIIWEGEPGDTRVHHLRRAPP